MNDVKEPLMATSVLHKPRKWILQMPIQELVKLTEFLDYSRIFMLESPVLLVFSTSENEFSVVGFKTLEEAKTHMEVEHDPSEGYTLESAYFEGKEMQWTEVKRVDFVVKKG